MTAVHRTFPAEPRALRSVRAHLGELAERAGLTPGEAHRLVLAANEACANVVVHSSSSEVELTWREEADRVEVEVADDGVFNARIGVPELDGEGHRGIAMMAALVDELTLHRGTPERPGTRARLVIRRSATAPRRGDPATAASA